VIENLSELSSYVSSWANIVSEVYEALRYPKDEYNPLDIKVGAYIVELSKQLVSKTEFREAFRCVEEFIKRSTEPSILHVFST